MNLNYIKEYLNVRKDTITSQDVEALIKEIEDYQATEGTFTDIAKIMRVVNEYNLTFLTLVEAYEAYPKGDIKLLPKRAEKAKLIAEKHNLKFVELQSKFDEAAKKAPNEYWLFDGVHPTPMGHGIIKNEWLKAFSEMQK